MTTPTPQAGDKIRVVIEAEVTDWATQAAAVAANGGELVSLEVLPKPFQVGDVLSSEDDYMRAPVGTLAIDALSGALLFKHRPNLWTGTNDFMDYSWNLSSPRDIVYLPDVA